jgi:hypothetical protein
LHNVEEYTLDIIEKFIEEKQKEMEKDKQNRQIIRLSNEQLNDRLGELGK